MMFEKVIAKMIKLHEIRMYRIESKNDNMSS